MKAAKLELARRIQERLRANKAKHGPALAKGVKTRAQRKLALLELRLGLFAPDSDLSLEEKQFKARMQAQIQDLKDA